MQHSAFCQHHHVYRTKPVSVTPCEVDQSNQSIALDKMGTTVSNVAHLSMKGLAWNHNQQRMAVLTSSSEIMLRIQVKTRVHADERDT